MPDRFPSSRDVAALRCGVEGADAAPLACCVPDEVPVALAFDGAAFAVLMATPADIEDLVYGFSLTEQIVRGSGDIEAVAVDHLDEGIAVDVRLTKAARAARVIARRRNIEGRSSCGICGIEQLSDAVRRLEPVSGRIALNMAVIARAMEALEIAQTLNRKTHAVHAAAFADADGTLIAVREDVGRHNALDKLIGALMRRGEDVTRGFCVITSRCSYEMVDKAAQAGFPALVAISAPTALALRKAREANMTLVALARRDGALVFADPKGQLGLDP